MSHPYLHANRGTWSRQPDAQTRIVGYPDLPEGAFNIVRMELRGQHVGLANRRSGMTYYIERATVDFDVDGTRFSAGTRDVVHVQPGQRRELRGDADMLIVTAPPWDAADENPLPNDE